MLRLTHRCSSGLSRITTRVRCLLRILRLILRLWLVLWLLVLGGRLILGLILAPLLWSADWLAIRLGPLRLPLWGGVLSGSPFLWEILNSRLCLRPWTSR